MCYGPREAYPIVSNQNSANGRANSGKLSQRQELCAKAGEGIAEKAFAL